MTEKDRLNEVIKSISDKYNLSDRKDIAAKLGMDSTYFSAMTGSSKNISRNFLEKLAKVFGVNKDYIKTGNGQFFTTEQPFIYNSGDFATNTINTDLSTQLAELINIQKEYQQLIKEKDKQIADLLEIIKTKNA